MKKTLCIVIVLFLAACHHGVANFVEYRGQDTFKGTGGAVETIDGIDFWSIGSPDRSFRVLGFIDYNPHGHFTSTSARLVLINQVKKIGGDGLIYYDSKETGASVEPFLDGAMISYAEQVRYIVIKYLE